MQHRVKRPLSPISSTHNEATTQAKQQANAKQSASSAQPCAQCAYEGDKGKPSCCRCSMMCYTQDLMATCCAIVQCCKAEFMLHVLWKEGSKCDTRNDMCPKMHQISLSHVLSFSHWMKRGDNWFEQGIKENKLPESSTSSMPDCNVTHADVHSAKAE